MPPPATTHDWFAATLVALGAFALLGMIWYLAGDPDRSDRLRARFGSRHYVVFAGIAVLQATHAVSNLSAGQWRAVAGSFLSALVWTLLALQFRRSPLFKHPAP